MVSLNYLNISENRINVNSERNKDDYINIYAPT